jgi:hypothetical protein
MTQSTATSVFAACLLLAMLGPNVQVETCATGPDDGLRMLHVRSLGDTPFMICTAGTVPRSPAQVAGQAAESREWP